MTLASSSAPHHLHTVVCTLITQYPRHPVNKQSTLSQIRPQPPVQSGAPPVLTALDGILLDESVQWTKRCHFQATSPPVYIKWSFRLIQSEHFQANLGGMMFHGTTIHHSYHFLVNRWSLYSLPFPALTQQAGLAVCITNRLSDPITSDYS